jgi:hypothetical protein
MVTSPAEQLRKEREANDPKRLERRRKQKRESSARSNAKPKRKEQKRVWQKKKNAKTKSCSPYSKILPISLADLEGNMQLTATRIIKSLLSPQWRTQNGMPYHIDTPSSNKPMGSMERPAVPRTHYGLDTDLHLATIGEYITRYMYGLGSGGGSVGTDCRYLQNKQMTHDMIVFAHELLDYLRQNKKKLFRGADAMDLEQAFNSVTILTYIGNDIIDEINSSSLSMHADQVYSTDGVFSTTKNTQKVNTPVVTVTMGDERTLHMAKRRVTKPGVWTELDDETNIPFKLNNGSVFVLHPSDEVPKERDGAGEAKSQFHHGGVKVTEGLSFAIVFRTVTQKAKIHIADNTRLLTEADNAYLNKAVSMGTSVTKPRRQHLDDALKAALRKKTKMERQFKKYLARRGDELYTGGKL